MGSTNSLVVGEMEGVDSHLFYQTQSSDQPNKISLVWPEQMWGVDVQSAISDVDPSTCPTLGQDVAGNVRG